MTEIRPDRQKNKQLGSFLNFNVFNISKLFVYLPESDAKSNGGGDDIVSETLESLLSSKMVKEKRTELARKLDALRRKYDKEKRPLAAYVSTKLVKKLSSKNM